MLPFDDEPDKIHTANFHVFSDSVLCLGIGARCGPSYHLEKQSTIVFPRS